jgi:hypothetical protein
MKESLKIVSLYLTGLTAAPNGTGRAIRAIHNALRLDNTLTFADIEELLALHPCENCQHLIKSICIPWASGEAGHGSIHENEKS